MGVWSFWARPSQGGHVLEPMKMSWPHVLKEAGGGFEKISHSYTKKGVCAAAGRRLVVTRQPWHGPLRRQVFQIFLFLFLFLFWTFEELRG
jgi:hypothetical protein